LQRLFSLGIDALFVGLLVAGLRGK
jgi:hypothetical protein